MALPRAPRSLKGRALQWLAQREQSRAELRRKLLPHARAEVTALGQSAASEVARGGFDGDGDGDGDGGTDRHSAAAAAAFFPDDVPPSAAERVDAVLDWLEAQGHLSAQRFVESRVHARSARFGNLRIRHELKQHQLVLSPDAAQALRDSELERACALRARKFSLPPADAAERARQARFLAGRGFTPEVIARALRVGAAASD